jgi:cell division cycle 2-like protein
MPSEEYYYEFRFDDDIGDSGGGASTLRSRLTRPFSEDETRALMRQLLGASEVMHGAGVTHRDINPDNIVVGAGGALKICGFRCAIMPTERFLGEPHPPMGTLQYCSPHQLNGLRCYCPAEDIWALGCVMAELLGGAPLFTEDTQEQGFFFLPTGHPKPPASGSGLPVTCRI